MHGDTSPSRNRTHWRIGSSDPLPVRHHGHRIVVGRDRRLEPLVASLGHATNVGERGDVSTVRCPRLDYDTWLLARRYTSVGSERCTRSAPRRSGLRLACSKHRNRMRHLSVVLARAHRYLSQAAVSTSVARSWLSMTSVLTGAACSDPSSRVNNAQPSWTST